MSTKTKFLRDDVANRILTDASLKDYVVRIISASTNIKREDIEDIKLYSPRINTNSNIKASNVDAIYENDKNIINLEVNMTESKSSQNKNMRYVFQLILKQVKKGDEDIYKKVWQININAFDIYKQDKFIYHSCIMEENLFLKRGDNLEIIDINLAKLESLSYNEIKEEDEDSLKTLLYIFTCEDKKKREELYRNNEIMKKVNEKLEDLTDDFDNILFYDYEEFKKLESEELGETAKAKEIAKNLLELKIDIETITKATGLTTEEIKELQEENK